MAFGKSGAGFYKTGGGLSEVDVEVNGSAYGTATSSPFDVDVEYEDGTDVGSLQSGTWEIPNNRFNSANTYKTGQTTSYASNDDGDLERGRGSDFTTLDFNNPFGNTNRFTDTLGGQTYADDIVIDWSTTNYIAETVLGWYRVVQGGAGVDWATAMGGQPYTIGSYNNLYIPNATELYLILNWELASRLNYAPFSISSTTASGGVWTSTTNPGDTTVAMRYNPNVGGGLTGAGLLNLQKTTASAGYMLLRTFTFTELGL